MSHSRAGENCNSYNNNIDSFNTVNSYFCNTGETAKILEWLSPLEPGIRHNGIRVHRVKNVGTGSSELRNIRIGTMEFAIGDPIIQPCSATEVRGLAGHTSGEESYRL